MKERVDMLEVDGDKYVAKIEDNTIPGKKDALVVEYDDKDFLENDREHVGDVYVLDEDLADNPYSVIEYLEEELKTNYQNRTFDSAEEFQIEGVESL